jgi:malonyl-CoA O-methyltransferase
MAYNEWVHQYDIDDNPTRDLNAEVLRQQPFDLVQQAVLEIGCGTGLNTVWLAQRARYIVALDIAEGMLSTARRRLGQRPIYFLQADVTKSWPLDHVFAEAHHMLRPGGLLYISELHPYKQLQGSQARYRDPETGAAVLVPAFHHSLSEDINGGIGAGLTLRCVEERQNASDATPRLMTRLFARPSVTVSTIGERGLSRAFGEACAVGPHGRHP